VQENDIAACLTSSQSRAMTLKCDYESKANCTFESWHLANRVL